MRKTIQTVALALYLAELMFHSSRLSGAEILTNQNMRSHGLYALRR